MPSIAILNFSMIAILLVAAPAQSQADCRLAVMGDSLSAGYGLRFEHAFPAQLQGFLDANGVRCEVQNHGVSGETSAGGLARLDWVLSVEPTHLILELGANDGLRALPVENMRANLKAIIKGAQKRNIQVMLAGMQAPPNLGTAYTSAFANVYRDLAVQHGLPLYPFFLHGVVLKSDLMLDDGLHPNQSGVAVIVERFGPIIAQWINGSN